MVKNITLTPEETLVSFEVSALFTSVPVAQAVSVTKTRLEENDTLHERTKLTVEDIVDILDLVLSTTYFMYNEYFYKQTHGAAMGSPGSPIVANLYMEHFEQLSLETVFYTAHRAYIVGAGRPAETWSGSSL